MTYRLLLALRWHRGYLGLRLFRKSAYRTQHRSLNIMLLPWACQIGGRFEAQGLSLAHAAISRSWRLMPNLYDVAFYAEIRGGSRRSAEIVVPLILAAFSPQSVCDVGCGVGTWLSVFIENGVTDVFGLDGAYTKSAGLMISEAAFKPTDLSASFSLPRRFDLAMSLEVAEHLPKDSARSFVESLTKLAPVIVFSAAIPNQGGTGHINEQWQNYWADLFAQHDYIPIDCIRPQIWNNPEVEWWYIQNVIVYCAADSLAKFPQIAALGPAQRVSMVHPRYVNDLGRVDVARDSHFSAAVKALPTLFLRAARGRWNKLVRQ